MFNFVLPQSKLNTNSCLKPIILFIEHYTLKKEDLQEILSKHIRTTEWMKLFFIVLKSTVHKII